MNIKLDKNFNIMNKQTTIDHNNKNQTKNPKLFQCAMIREKDGSFSLLGNTVKVYSRKNQYSGKWKRVDTRDFTQALKNNKITCL